MDTLKPKYIDKDNLLQLFRDSYRGCKAEIAKGRNEFDTAFTGYKSCMSLAENMPTADVQEVKQGKWNYYTKTNVICSCCNFIRNIETQIAWEFCPKCGAKMLEDE